MYLRLLATLSIALVAACATPTPTGTSVADQKLTRDVVRSVGDYENALGAKGEPKLLSTQAVEKDGAGNASEWWTFDRGTRQVVYLTKFMTAPQGGTNFSITFLGYRVACSGPDCTDAVAKACDGKRGRYLDAAGKLVVAPALLRDERDRPMAIVSC